MKRTLLVLMMVCLAAFLSVGMVGCSGGGGDTAPPADLTEDGTVIATPEYEAGERALAAEGAPPAVVSAPTEQPAEQPTEQQ